MPREIERNQILITKQDQNKYDVQWGDCKQDQLTWEEMLGSIACLTLIGKPRFPVTTIFSDGGEREKPF